MSLPLMMKKPLSECQMGFRCVEGESREDIFSMQVPARPTESVPPDMQGRLKKCSAYDSGWLR